MKTVIVKDEHVHGIHNGMELFLVKVTDTEGYTSITGFRPNVGPDQGMFDCNTEPVQVLRKKDGQWMFTMCQLMDVSRNFVNKLINDRKAVIIDSYNGQILSKHTFVVV